jgi:GNAT superfamily N-acetyltransferase
VNVDANGDADTPIISLRSMNAAEFEPWAENSLRVFAAERAAAIGLSLEESLARARQLPERLPQGQATPGMWLFIVVDANGTDVGSLWLGMDPDRSDAMFVWAIDIREEFRGKGFGRAAMTSAEELARDVGANAMTLNVFGPNAAARALYESLGYEIASIQMIKTIGVP